MRTRDLSQRTKKKGVTKDNMCLIYHKTPANQTFANIWKKKKQGECVLFKSVSFV